VAVQIERRSDGAASRTTLGVIAALVVAVLGIGGAWLLVTGRGLPRLGRPVAVTVGISAVPDATGTQVEMVAESADDSMPSTVDVDLTRADTAALIDGGSSSGGLLVYSDVRDSFGSLLPPDQVRAARLVAVPTDGRRLRLTFHVATVNGQRIFYPIPRLSGVTWNWARLYLQTGRITCWANGSDEKQRNSYRRCPGGESPDRVDGGGHSALRLELSA
jgi:hypothetical protein